MFPVGPVIRVSPSRSRNVKQSLCALNSADSFPMQPLALGSPAGPGQIDAVLNWTEELARLVPTSELGKVPSPLYFSFLHKGIHHRFSLDKYLGRRIESYGDARAEADRLRVAIRDGKFMGIHVDAGLTHEPALTFGEFADLWMARESIKPAAHRDHGYRIARFKDFPPPGTRSPSNAWTDPAHGGPNG